MYKLFVLPKKEKGDCSLNITLRPVMYKSMLIIPISHDRALHIHHWIFYSILLIFGWNYLHSSIIGFSTALIMNGLSYGDRFEILTDNPYT